MKYTVELSETALRELAKLTGKSYSEVTRSDMNISHTVEDYIHTSFNKLSKDNGMKKYIVSCPVMGYLEEIPHEDGEINEALLRAFDSADFGKLYDVDLEKNEFWAVRGYYSFEVEGENEKEALEKAPNVFNRLWDNGKVDCGDLIDTDRVKFKDGNKESFRIQSEELYERLTNEANDLYQYNCDSAEFEFCVNAATLLDSYAKQSEDQWKHLKELIGYKKIPLPSNHGEYLFEYLVNLDDKKLNEICKNLELKPQKTYIISVQNGEYEECLDESQVIERFKKLVGKYEGLSAVIVSVDGAEFKGTLNTNNLKELKEMFGIKGKEPKSIEKE